MENITATTTTRLPQVPGASGLFRLRLTTVALCVGFVAAGVAANSARFLQTHQSFVSPAGFFEEQVNVLGLLAAALAVLTLGLGLSYGRGLARRIGVDPKRARAVHMTLACCTVGTIVLHVLAIAAGSLFALSLAELLVPFVWSGPGGFPYPLAAGIVAVWLIVLFGLSYFVRGRLGGHRRWRVLHRIVLVAVALSLVHTVFLGWIASYGLG